MYQRRNEVILDHSSLLFHWPSTKTDIRPSASSAVRLTQTCNKKTAAAVVLPTRITNNAGATNAQIAPFSSESQQLQRKIRIILDETHGHLISNVLN